MQDLPEELQEEILFSVQGAKNLHQACSASGRNRRICSGSAFWREKFAREGLHLLERVVRSSPDLQASHSSSEQGESFAQWIKLYAKALQASRLAQEQLYTEETKGVNLEQLPDLSYLPVWKSFYNPTMTRLNRERI
jgi:hypothetical protein